MITGLRPDTFTKLQLNAGLFLKNFDASAITDAAALKTAVASAISKDEGVVGATKGGGTFVCEPDIRQIEADGMRAPFVGSTVNDGWTVKLTGTMLEMTPDNFKDALMSADVTTDASNPKVKKVRIRTDLKSDDYIDTLCWIGDTSKGYVMIELENALNIAGATFTFTDKGEGTIPFEFQAHQSDVLQQDYAPCTLLFFDPPAAETVKEE